MRRVFYFLITNLAILIVLGTVLRLLGVQPHLPDQMAAFGILGRWNESVE